MRLAEWCRGLRLAQWGLSPQRRRIARGLLARADRARESQLHRDAGVLFEELARLWPKPGRFHVQAGHMFKEAGDLARAETQYRTAAALMPDDADLALQLGHFYKVAERAGEALVEYRRAVGLKPGWREALAEVRSMEDEGAGLLVPDAIAPDLDEDDGAIAELLPGLPVAPAPLGSGEIELRKLGGRHEPSPWGRLPRMSGIEAIRGVFRSTETIETVELLLDGETLHTERAQPVAGPAGANLYVFNIWVDVSGVRPGAHRIEVRMIGTGGPVRRREAVVLIAALAVADRGPPDDRSVEQRVRSLPSVAHPARRDTLGAIERILVLRTDQLGDMVVSIPALVRLRALFPTARIVGLLTAANADMARSTGLFDEVLEIDFPVDPIDQRRVLTRSEQSALRRRLAAYRFDLCIDLGVGRLSRPLMRLADARILVGVNDREWPWLTVGLDGEMHDPKNHGEAAPHSAKLSALVDRVATLVDSGARIVRRADLPDSLLEPFGVTPGRYLILHCGAAQTFTRWPRFAELARRMRRQYDHRILILGGADVAGDAEFVELARDPCITLVTSVLPFDAFDALISFAALFVGNDSGPKHLAALRGVPVISLHNSRTNWGEWGQEQTGVILSRDVPCSGCSVTGDGHECGKAFACLTDITIDEVMDAAMTLLPVTPALSICGSGR